MTTSAAKRLTVDEYLALEQSSEVKHEYFDGEIFAMAGGKASHNLISMNLGAEVRNAVKSRGCLVFPSDMMVFCPTGLRAYPDLSVTCGSPTYEDDRELTLMNPIVIVEVPSDSSEAYDRGRKFEHYKTIESLQEYVLAAQDRAHVDHFARQPDGRWLLASATGLEESLELPSLGCSIPLSEIYSGVSLKPPADPPTDATENPALRPD